LLHNSWFKIGVAVLGELFVAISLSVFIVPMNLYSGYIMGACQLINTVLQNIGIIASNKDIAGLIYYLINMPILLLALKSLGRDLVVKTIICTTAFSLFYSIIPSPAQPLVSDYWTACLLGGVLSGIGYGIVLTCGSSGGGLDILGLYLNKKGINISIGRFSLFFNIVLYSICFFMFNAEIVIYSVIFNYFATVMQDKMHKQGINVQAFIFTRQNDREIGRFIMDRLGRGVTYLEGTGGYTGEDIQVMCVYLSKYEVEELLNVVHSIDPNAFCTVQEGVRVYGNFKRRLS